MVTTVISLSSPITGRTWYEFTPGISLDTLKYIRLAVERRPPWEWGGIMEEWARSCGRQLRVSFTPIQSSMPEMVPAESDETQSEAA